MLLQRLSKNGHNGDFASCPALGVCKATSSPRSGACQTHPGPPFAVRAVGSSFLPTRPAVRTLDSAPVVCLQLLQLPVDLIVADYGLVFKGTCSVTFDGAYLQVAIRF